MLTRSKARMATQEESVMETGESTRVSEVEVNNQLGYHQEETSEDMELIPQVEQIRAGGLPTPKSDFDKLYELLFAMNKKNDENYENLNKKADETNKKADEANKKNEENFKKLEQRLDDTDQKLAENLRRIEENFDARCDRIEQQNKEAKEQVDRNTEDIQRMKEDVIQKIEKQEKELKSKLGETNKRMSKQMNDSEERSRKQVEELKGSINQQREDTNGAIETVKRSVEEVKRTTDEKFSTMEGERSQRLKEVSSRMERLQRRLMEAEMRPTPRTNGDGNKEVRYDGTDPYPMEFLKELTEEKEKYWEGGEVKWIGQHLEKDASIWWRIVKDQIRSFDEFVDVFTEKYWSTDRQELARDNLEYGRYDPRGKLSSVQYLEQKILEFKQLTPAIPEKLLVRKLAKHFGRNIQIAAITRGIVSVTTLANVLTEYDYLYKRQFNTEIKEEKPYNERNKERWVQQERERNTKTFNQNKPKGFSSNNKEFPKQKQQVSVIDTITVTPSTSKKGLETSPDHQKKI